MLISRKTLQTCPLDASTTSRKPLLVSAWALTATWANAADAKERKNTPTHRIALDDGRRVPAAVVPRPADADPVLPGTGLALGPLFASAAALVARPCPISLGWRLDANACIRLQ